MPKEEEKKNACCSGNVMEDMKKLGNNLISLVKDAKDKYDNADDKTKKKVLAGIVGATALLAGAIHLKKKKKK